MDFIGLLGIITIHTIALVFIGIMLFNMYVATTMLVSLYYGDMVLVSVYSFKYFMKTIFLGSAYGIIFPVQDLRRRATRRWAASRRRATEPWTGLRIVQPRQHGPSSPAPTGAAPGPVAPRLGGAFASAVRRASSSSSSSSSHGRLQGPARPADGVVGARASPAYEDLGGPARPGASRLRGKTHHRPSGTMEWRTYVEDADEE